ncbi:hypothetical protein F0562_016991 [Nyssa sinensis]|uniref:Uncharacterized protein n=1 Tax=Nyssa sinensis TaxID=561372 RepID=A0A5J4ZD00_9ASTE|nr:hypothetical protein F0562_016991 [Nyssa sinensis]
MQMDIRLPIGSITSHCLWSTSRNQKLLKPCCSRRDSRQSPQQNGDNDKGDRSSTDWDKAWASFRKQGKRTFFSQFSPDKYVSWNPRRSNYPPSEEVDPIKRTERSNLMLWTSPRVNISTGNNFGKIQLDQLKPYWEFTNSVAMEMANGSVNPQKARIPPRRGQIKGKIIYSCFKKLSKIVSNVMSLGRKKMRKEEKVMAEEGQPPQLHFNEHAIPKVISSACTCH